MKNKNNFRRVTAIVALSLAGAGATIGVASAQSTSTSTAATSTTASTTKPMGQGRGGMGGFNAHADTIAKALGITSAQLQTELSSGKSVAQIASAKGVNLQTVIDAYVAEEVAEHPEMAKADVVARVTARLNGVRPTGGRGGMGRGAGRSTTRTASTSNTVAVTSVSA